MTSIYDRPVRELVQDALAEMPDPFRRRDMEEWFAERYPRIRPGTVRFNLRFASVNVPLRPDEPRWPNEERTAYRLGKGLFTRYRHEVHGDFEDGLPAGLAEEMGPADLDENSDGGTEAAFALEVHLEEFMEANWEAIDFGRPLRIRDDPNGGWGRQYETDVGRIDFLCEDEAASDLVVVELKRGKSSDRVVGQTLRYMGWVREHLADGRGVSGIIITHEYDDRVRYAVAELPNVEAWTYSVSFALDTKAFAS